MSDAPAHHLFCLVKPIVENEVPEVLVFIQVCLEGQLSKDTIHSKLGRGQKAAGDLIPWTIAEKFNDQNFPMLSGARIVRIATHPEYQGQGYGTKALELLKEYYSTGKNKNLGEDFLHIYILFKLNVKINCNYNSILQQRTIPIVRKGLRKS